MSMGVVMDRRLLSVLVCPQTGGALRWVEDRSELWCSASGLAYAVRSGVPVMMVDQARLLSPEEIDQISK